MPDQDQEDTKNKVQQNKGLIEKFLHRILIESCFVFNQRLSNKICLFFMISAIIWIILFILFDQAALPGGPFFSLWTLVTFSHILGFMFELIKMPSLLGKKIKTKKYKL